MNINIDKALVAHLNKLAPYNSYGTKLSKCEVTKHNYNYLKLEKDLSISFIKENSFSKVKKNHPYANPFKTKTRQKTKLSKILNHFFPNDRNNVKLYEEHLTYDVDNFLKERGLRIEILRGEDIPLAFNSGGHIRLAKFGQSCANWRGNPVGDGYKRWLESLNIYTMNDIFHCVTIWDKNNKMVARAMCAGGEALETIGTFEKGKVYNVSNRVYSEGNSNYTKILNNWFKANGYIRNGGYRTFIGDDDKIINTSNNLKLKLNKTKLGYYCPVDNWFCDINKKEFLMYDDRKGSERMYNLYTTKEDLKLV